MFQEPLQAVEPAAQPELLCDVLCELGESPVWDERRDALYWCDIPAGRIHRFHPASGALWHMDFPDTVGSLGLCESGRLIVACGMQVLIADPDSGARRTIARIGETGFPCRLNDGRVGPDGAFWVGTMHDVAFTQMQPVAALFRVDGVGEVRKIAAGFKVSNGLAFSPDGRVLYHSDSVQMRVEKRVFDAATGEIGSPELLCEAGEELGRPDGACVDIDGVYWSAGVSAGRLNGFDETGRLVGQINLPVPHPTMPCFGGADFDTLFITSHRHTMSPQDRLNSPWSGGVLRLPTARRGRPAPRFDDRGIA